MISKGHKIKEYSDILKTISEEEILFSYTNLSVPILIKSPFRKDNNPSFSIYQTPLGKIKYRDFATGDSGGLLDFLSMWLNKSHAEIIDQILEEAVKQHKLYKSCRKSKVTNKLGESNLLCTIRKWEDYDIAYWKQFGISIKWLKYAEIYPIKYIIYEFKDGQNAYLADKLAYAYVEHKEGNTTLKIYQPYNKTGFKWRTKHNSSVISLWTKIPEKGNLVCICSSVKDALCLWENTGIPSLAIQGEGYGMSKTAIEILKKRYSNIIIIFDNDKAGLEDGAKFSKLTGFINIILPQFDGGKDISDLFSIIKNKQMFNNKITSLIKKNLPLWNQELLQ